MTLPEAMYCMSSYLPDTPDNHCEKCPYYQSEKFVIDGKTFYKCKEQDAHRIVLNELNRISQERNNKKVISLGGSSNGKTEQLLHVNGGSEGTRMVNDSKTR